ncbi:MAG: hypothetical protein JXA06_00625 [Bacteroidetes bacterium]|nr:hypothetical protein [Bacteroidota bacterium]
MIKTKILYASEKDDGFGKIEVYIDLEEKGKWILDEEKDSDSELPEGLPKISQEGKFLFYSPKRNGKGSICTIDVHSIVKSIKSNLNIV